MKILFFTTILILILNSQSFAQSLTYEEILKNDLLKSSYELKKALEMKWGEYKPFTWTKEACEDAGLLIDCSILPESITDTFFKSESIIWATDIEKQIMIKEIEDYEKCTAGYWKRKPEDRYKHANCREPAPRYRQGLPIFVLDGMVIELGLMPDHSIIWRKVE